MKNSALIASLSLVCVACSGDSGSRTEADASTGVQVDVASDTQGADGSHDAPADAAASDAGPDALADGSEDATPADATPSDADSSSADADTSPDAPEVHEHEVREYPLDGVLRLNHVQVKGTHNSYHVEPARPLDPSHRYTHAPLDVQLEEYGVRQFEIDVHYERDGYFRVFHLPVIDAESTCDRFVDCLRTVRRWSDAHPRHAPIFIWIEPKDELDPDTIPGHYDELDAEIRSVFVDRLITPAMVQADHPTLREAVLADGWPTLGEVRGHVVFVLLDSDDHQRRYTYDNTSLDGRAMFVDVNSLDEPYAAFVKYNDPIGSGAAITAATEQGFIVACNGGSADGSDEQNQAKIEAGLAVGAHMIGTDVPFPIGDRYWFDMPGGEVARCNPISAPAECEAVDIE